MTQKKVSKEKQSEVKQVVVTRGKVFQGFVTKVFPQRAVIEFERTTYVPKYERFKKGRTRLHSRIPQGMTVNVGDYVKARECRPLSKIIHSVIIEIVRKASTETEKKS